MGSCKVQVELEAAQTVVPTKPTQSYTLHIHTAALLHRRFHILLCYNTGDYHSTAGWMKESLGVALQERPLLAGRLRRRSDCDDMEMVANDSGVRLREARSGISLSSFLEMKDKAEAEAELAFWDEVPDHTPQFSPLFYVQVTSFSCGGYSIGISCSLLLGDPFVLTTFIKKWVSLHNTLVSSIDLPIFYLPSLGKQHFSKSPLLTSTSTKTRVGTLLIKITNDTVNIDNNLVAKCINRAEVEVAAKMAPQFSLYIRGNGYAKVEICSTEDVIRSGSVDNDDSKVVSCERFWCGELGFDNVCFNGDNKPIYANGWINSTPGQGCVIIVPLCDDDENSIGIKAFVTFA